MKLNSNTIAYLNNAVKTAQSLNIDSLIIQDNNIRGIDENKSVVICDHTVPDLSTNSIGINRISIFLSRLDLVKDKPKFEIEATIAEIAAEVDEESGEILQEAYEYAGFLKMKSENLKVEYRCADPRLMSAPKKIKDISKYRIQMSQTAIQLISKGAVAMTAEQVSLIYNGDQVLMELTDINNDVLSHVLTDDVEILCDEDTRFSHKYPVKILLQLFKQHPENYFEIGQKGILKTNINGLDIFVLPQL